MATYPKTADVAYLRHTSGTSSGLPKPIYQTNWGAVGILPRLRPTGQRPATFSTTPLYHGGLADCFRAWAAGAMIWFFPEGITPVTGANVVQAVEFARSQQGAAANVGYFTSVPYVLQMLSEADEGIRLLRSIDLVGVGGAALPVAVGDKLVDQDVRLVSRMGSAECGFLLSSERDYAADKEWQFLRPAATVVADDILAFEARGDDGLSELVARPGWPLRAKTNRPDGSYATADLFEAHPSIPDAWRYHSRSDAQIALGSGKKFDPAPLEGAILASTRHLRDVLVFGGGRDYPGALLFPSDGGATSESEVVDAAWPAVQELNRESQSYARLSKAMLVAVPAGAEGGTRSLPKSSKGTIMRRQAEEQYGQLIENAYGGGESDKPTRDIADDGVPSAIVEKFAQVLGREDLDPTEDLYGQGVDSIACIQIRKAIERDLLPAELGPLPINIIYDCGTMNELVGHILMIRQRQSSSENAPGLKETMKYQQEQRNADLALMEDLVQQYSDFGDLTFSRRAARGDGITVILTGATGALGTHIVHTLLQDRSISKIYCLLRAETFCGAHQRVSQALMKRGLPRLEAWDEDHWSEARTVCLPAELGRSDLGLAPRILQGLQNRAAVIVHAAWAVNFRLRVSSFGPHFAATRNLIRLAAGSGSRLCFVSSTAAVNNASASSPPSPGSTIAEKMSTNPADAAPLGYAKSKWVAENICAAAHEKYVSEASERHGNDHDLSVSQPPPVSVIRVGQLFANHLGIWNASEAYPLMLSTHSFTGCLPDLGDEPLNWLPVELAAQAVMEIALNHHDSHIAPNQLSSNKARHGNNEIPVYHVLNPHRQPTWRKMLEIITSRGSTWKQRQNQVVPSFEIVPPPVWVQRLEASLNGNTAGHSSEGLLDLWKGKYAEATPKRAGPVFELGRTEAASRTVRGIQPLDDTRILQMWKWLQERSGLCC